MFETYFRRRTRLWFILPVRKVLRVVVPDQRLVAHARKVQSVEGVRAAIEPADAFSVFTETLVVSDGSDASTETNADTRTWAVIWSGGA